MQKAGEGYPGDTFLTKLITRNLGGNETKGNEIFMDLQTGIVSARCHVAEGEIFQCAWFSSSNIVSFARCLFVLGWEGADGY